MITSAAQIESRIFLIRGQKVMLSQHLAELHEIDPQALNQAVKRYIERFPDDFMFQLDAPKRQTLRSQIVTSNEKPAGHEGRRPSPCRRTAMEGVETFRLVLSTPQPSGAGATLMPGLVINHNL